MENINKLSKSTLIFSLLLTNLSCAPRLYEFSESQEKEFSSVRVLTSEQNIQNCDFLRPLEVYSHAENFFWKTHGTYTNAMKLLQYHANKNGANLAIIDKLEEPRGDNNSYGIKSRIFKCR